MDLIRPALYLIATPLGAPQDWGLRARAIVGALDALAVEDTRKTRRLLADCALAPPPILFSCHEHNERRASLRLRTLLEEEKAVGLCSDAGTPCLSDPGFHMIGTAREAGAAIIAIPGPSAPANALALSGLSGARYVFLGYPPRRSAARRRFFADEAEGRRTLVFFESPHRLGECLCDACAALGERESVLCFEMSKRHERTERGTLGELAARHSQTRPFGEVTVVVAGKARKR